MTETPRIDPGAFRSFELAGWETVAGTYADHWTSLTSQTIESLLGVAQVTAGTTLLDVASGPGFVAAAAAERGAAVAGLDFSPLMADLARRSYPAVHYVIGDAEALPLRDNSRAAVVMNFGMLHLARPEHAIAEALRVLRPGGRYAFTVWATPEYAKGFAIVLKAIEEHGNPNVPLPAGPPIFRFSDADTSRAALAEAGFVDINVERLPLVWRIRTPAAIFEGMHRGTPRTGAVLRAQTPEALAAIRAAVLADLAAYVEAGEVRLPMPAMLASATAT